MAKPKEVLTGENTVPVQAEIPGTEQERIPAIESAADKYDEARRLWQGQGEELINLKAKVVETMHMHEAGLAKDGKGTLAYTKGDYKIVISAKENVKVKIAKDDEPGFDTDEDHEEAAAVL